MRKFIGGPGKGMIVCATRDICADLYERIIELRPDWHSDDVAAGKVKVVFTGDASDPRHLQKHIRRPAQNKVIQQRAKDPDDELELLIVQSMLLTGFDAPPLHTIYIDKPMRGAALMQALARVNRTFRDKQDGLLVAYAPLTDNLYEALAEYSDRDQNTKPMGRDLDDAVAKVRDMLAVIGDEILSGYDWRAARAAGGPRAHLEAVMGAVNYLRDPVTPGNQVAEDELTLGQRFRQASATLARMYALCSSHRDMATYRPDIAFFEEIRTWMARYDAADRRARGETVPPDIELYLKALTASAIESGGVTDIYAAAGLERPDLSHLDEAFIERMRAQRNPALAIEALRRVIEQEMRKVTKHNIVKQASFSQRLADLMRRYTNQNLSSAEVIALLVEMAKEVSADANRGSGFAPPLDNAELAFYDAVAQNESAVTEMGTNVLADIARDLVRTLRRDVTTDWVLPRRRPRQDPLDHQAPSRQARLSPRRPRRRHRTGPAPDGNLRRRVVSRCRCRCLKSGHLVITHAVIFGHGTLNPLQAFGDVGHVGLQVSAGGAFQDGADVSGVADLPGLRLLLELT